MDKALALDPNLAEGLAALGLYHMEVPAEIDQAIEALEKAVQINPGLINASQWLWSAYQRSGNANAKRNRV